MKAMKVLLMGLGSIGKRHKRVLEEIAPGTQFFALRSQPNASAIENVVNCYSKSEVPSDIDFAIISTPSSVHYESLQYVLGLRVPIFLEKPPFSSLDGIDEMVELAKGVPIYTAFNFRFHDLIRWAKEHLDKNDVLEATAYCGSYLPAWRAGVDYRESYSAKAAMGGGVHLDVIHELDYVVYLWGLPKAHTSYTAKVSDLEIDSPDYAHYLLNFGHFNASITLNYYRKDTKRTLEVVTKGGTLLFDMIGGKITNERGEVVYASKETVSDTYYHQLRYFIDCIANGKAPMNSLEESVATLKIALT